MKQNESDTNTTYIFSAFKHVLSVWPRETSKVVQIFMSVQMYIFTGAGKLSAYLLFAEHIMRCCHGPLRLELF